MWHQLKLPRNYTRIVHPRLFQVGSIAIPTAAVFTAFAIVVALFTARITARRLELNPEKVWDLGIVGVLTALFAPRLILIFANWKDFLAHPLWLIGVVRVRSEVALLGGIAVAIVVVCAFAFFTRMPFRRTLDALAPSLALGFAIASLGAFAGGSDFGTPTSLPWAITYTSRLASLWNGAPLGTPLHPVQIYAAVVDLCLLALLLTIIAKRLSWKIRSGEIMGAWLFLHGVVSFLLNLLRGGLVANDFLLAQTLAAAMVLTGGLLWLF
jgi:phosphatidylglycerol:prolipoprotein diacylglycerol transferase